MTCTTCLVCFISTVNCHSKKKGLKCGASSGHITNLKQSIISFDIYGSNIVQKYQQWPNSDICWASVSCTMVEHLPRHPEVTGSCPAAVSVIRGRFVEQNLMISSSFRCDQISKYERCDFGHTLLWYLSLT